MRKSAVGAIAAAVLAGGSFALLAGCSGTADEPAVTPMPAPSRPPADPSDRAIPPTTSSGRAPLGLEVRYVDADGKFQTLAPKDFRR